MLKYPLNTLIDMSKFQFPIKDILWSICVFVLLVGNFIFAQQLQKEITKTKSLAEELGNIEQDNVALERSKKEIANLERENKELNERVSDFRARIIELEKR